VALNAGGHPSPGIGLTGSALMPAVALYHPASVFSLIYQDLHVWARANGHQFAILSAGWGWVDPDFKLPTYDITFSSMARTKTPERFRPGGTSGRFSPGHFKDFKPSLGPGVNKIILLGGQSYVNLFCFLCPPGIPKEIFSFGSRNRLYAGVASRPYTGGNRRIWYYQAAQDIISGKIKV
jgi:hypothetical protein